MTNGPVFILCPVFLNKRRQAIAREKLVAEKARVEAEALNARRSSSPRIRRRLRLRCGK